MKKLLSILLSLMLLAGSALAEATPVNTAITIDGVRVAFFDAEGNYLQSKENDGLLWVPLNALCENLGKTAQVQGQSIMVDGVRIGMFDEAGNFLMPQEVNGTVYVPVMAFCQSIGVEVQATENGLAIVRAAAAPATQVAPAPTAEPEPEHPEYVAVYLDTSNFGSYFSCNISVENFKNWDETYKGGGNYIVFQHWSCDYRLRATALTPYKFENVRFAVTNPGIKANSQYDVKGVTFSNLTMPQSGEMTRTESYKGTYLSMYTIINSADDVLYDANDLHSAFFENGHTSVTNVSGKVYIPWEEAQTMLENKYQRAQADMESNNYQAAVNRFSDLAMNQYKDSAAKLAEAQEKLAAQKAQKQKGDYAAAQAAFDNGDWDTAIKGFGALGDYEDSKAKVTEATENKNSEAYEKALAFEKDGQYAEAIAAFEALKDYKDSAQHLAACRTDKTDKENRAAYEAAEKLEASGDYVGAYDTFIKLANYEDSEERAKKLAVYPAIAEAKQKVEEGNPIEAKALLESYKDHEAATALYKTVTLRSAELSGAFNSKGWAVASMKDGKTTQKCLLNIEGDTKSEYSYSYWRDGLMLVEVDGGYAYLNLEGEKAFEGTFKEAESFYQGKALVTGPDGNVCVIDTAGQTVAQMPAVNGRTYLTYAGENLVKFKEKDKYGLINLDGKVVVKAKYTKSISKFEHGLAVTCTQKGKKYAYSVINPKGKAVIKEGKYEIMNVLSENLIACYLRNDNWGKGKTYPGVINLKGKTILKGEYDNKEFHRVGDYIMMKREGTSPSGTRTSWQVYDKEGKYLMGYQSNIRPLVSGDGKHVYIENYKGGVKQLALLHEPNQWRRDLDGCQMDQASPYIALKKNDGWHVYDLDLNLIN